jgi:hypothetical protein
VPHPHQTPLEDAISMTLVYFERAGK